ncbi:DUF2937 family protein [Roseovarius sp. 2305UL8-3]|uniref:DUF2937 family protein n=1 Tax=Roseovarius conchicola TaxID=3121636 RepID=UPI003529BAB5
MFVRVLILMGGMTGAAGLSQFPEFSQQYTQRLAGKVEELSRFVEEFDADASDVGASREQALVDLAQGGAIGAERAQTIVTTIERQDRLSAALEELRGAGPFTRAFHANAFTDSELARGTLSDFKPALPLSFEGLVFAGVGFLMGLGLLSGFNAICRQLFLRRKVT